MANCTECTSKLNKKFLSELRKQRKGFSQQRYILCEDCKNVMIATMDVLGRIKSVEETPKDNSDETKTMMAEALKLFEDAGINIKDASLTKSGNKISKEALKGHGKNYGDFDDEDSVESGDDECDEEEDDEEETVQDEEKEEQENQEESSVVEEEKEDIPYSERTKTRGELDAMAREKRCSNGNEYKEVSNPYCKSSDDGHVQNIKKEWNGPKSHCEGCQIQEELKAMLNDTDSEKMIRGLRRLLLALGGDK